MTRRLYYDDATLCTFTAHVVQRARLKDEAGVMRSAVRLDQTAFYPTSGGQPYDVGTVAGVHVVEVLEDAEGDIWHLLSEEFPAEQDLVQGVVDWQRRFDHMQQHSGQHLLSAAFEETLKAHTLSFHLGSEESTIDLDIPDLSDAAAFSIERHVNAVVWQDRPVGVQIVEEDQLSQIALRKPPAVSGEIRVVSVENYDASACGGTHVARTGEVGLIKITRISRYKGGVRVGFLCGSRALAHYQRTLSTLQDASVSLSVGQDELLEAIERLEDEAKTARKALGQARTELAEYESERLWRQAPIHDGTRVVTAHWPDRPFSEIQALASQLRERPKTVVLLAVTEDTGDRLVCTRSDDLIDLDAAAILGEALGPLDGRGGGSPVMAQGGAAPHPSATVSAALERALTGFGLR